ncbi:MAG: class II aldolase/adducin family protein, partial [Chloroflexota bacterium]|nr:class II aldolase/adducin family protein [Chloroflexota bacterium]
MDSLEPDLRQELIEITNRPSSRGLIRAGGGNLSVRLDDETFLITPTLLVKGYLRESDIMVVDQNGHLVRGDSPSSLDTA